MMLMINSPAINFLLAFVYEYAVVCIICGAFAGVGIAIISKHFPKKIIASAMLIFCILPLCAVVFVWVINPNFIGAGYSTEGFDVIATGEKDLCAINSWTMP